MARQIQRSPWPPRVEVIHNAVDVSRFDPGERRGGDAGPVFACAGRLVAGKGVGELIRAFAPVAAADGGAVLRVAGDGPERGQLEDLVRRLGLDGRVELLGVVDDMPGFWAGCDVSVTPSTLPESFGLAALEGMASAKPVVATAHGGIVEVVEDGVTGRLVTPGDVEALSAALRDYAADPELRRRHGRAGRERCEARFGMDGCAAAYVRLVAELSP
jgi:glycosyltransferase involved in cell wall biosynthesis